MSTEKFFDKLNDLEESPTIEEAARCKEALHILSHLKQISGGIYSDVLMRLANVTDSLKNGEPSKEVARL